MRDVQIVNVKGTSLSFNILEPADFEDCDHNWEGVEGSRCINPNGEFVEGYGHVPVLISVIIDYKCSKCNVLKSYVQK